MKILGIDPGIGICGFGMIETNSGANPKALDFGAVTTKVDAPMPSRLGELYDSLKEVFEQTKPDVVAVEKLFFSKNITTGIAVAEARGIVLLVAEQSGLPVYEYTPNEIKKILTGYGSATKAQMQEMVRVQLGLANKPKPDDAADALAVAIVCGYLYKTGETGGSYKFSNNRHLDFSLERKVQKKKPVRNLN
ncbi:crossover junction endodeoxyribonuclease RuvC [Candidatus Saccharibacteria bacterium]|nr:crossover junction endodeoxyribonuclease RuvC [Candidatus Saccharibacteria bacterium]